MPETRSERFSFPMSFPDEMLYSEHRHTWIKLEGNGNAKVGITPLAIAILGAIKNISGKNIGTTVPIDYPLAVMESAFAVGFLFAPVSCVLVSLNPNMTGNPALVNQQTYQNWIAEIRPLNFAEDSKHLRTSAEMSRFSEKILATIKSRLPNSDSSSVLQAGCCGGTSRS